MTTIMYPQVPPNLGRGGRRQGAGRRRKTTELRDGQTIVVTFDPLNTNRVEPMRVSIRFQDGTWRTFIEGGDDAPTLMIEEAKEPAT